MINDNCSNRDLITYSIAEAAAIMGVPKDTVYRLVRTGKLPHVRLGCTRIRHDTLARFLKEAETTQYWEVRIAS